MSFHGPLLALEPVVLAAEAVVLGLVAAAVTMGASFLYRLRARAELPDSVALLLGLGSATAGLGTQHIFVQFVGGTPDVLGVPAAAGNVLVLAVAGVAAVAGNQLGLRLATSAWARERSWHLDVSPLVRVTGRAASVTLPDEIGDVDGYDPVPQEVKEALAGETLDFPRGLTVAQLEEQLALRIQDEHEVGYVDAEVTRDGDVPYLALGHRPAGIGPTLPPGSAAVALRADPPLSATAGDTVQIWRTHPEPERVATGELRAAVDDVATVAVDEEAAGRLDPTDEHRLVTLPGDENPERDLAAALRRADETLGVLAVDAGGPLEGRTLGSLEVAVIAVEAADGTVETIPSRDRPLAAGEVAYVLGRPEALRRLEAGEVPEAAQARLEEARGAAGGAGASGD